VAQRQRTCNKKGLTVIVRHVAAPDAKQRLSRVVDVLLRVTTRRIIAEDENRSHHSPREEGLATGKQKDSVEKILERHNNFESLR